MYVWCTRDYHVAKMDKFEPGTKVLAYHGPLVYEAKVLKFHQVDLLEVEIADGETEPLSANKIPGFLLEVDAYFLHYKGWSPKWDEWVSNERIMEFNNDNLGLSRELRNARKQAIKRIENPRGDTGEASERENDKAKTKKKRKAVDKSAPKKKAKAEPKPQPEILLPLRPQLKVLLVDDWEFLTKDRKLVDLEKTVPVKRILAQYYDYKSRQQSVKELEELARILRETLHGLEVYFNKMLRFNLLYRLERLQWSQLLEKEKDAKASEHYGLEHLLRLLVTLPARIAQTPMDTVSVTVLMGQMKDLLDFLNDNLATFVSLYMYTSPAYDRLARG